jgi:hypothetical protein
VKNFLFVNFDSCKLQLALPLGDLGGRLRLPVEEGPISQVSKTWKKALRNVCKNKIIKNNNNNAQIYSTTILKKKKKKKCIISSCRTILAPTEKSIMRSPRIQLFPKQIVH